MSDKHECPICGRVVHCDLAAFQHHAERCLDEGPIAGPSRPRSRSPSLEIIGGPYGEGQATMDCPICAQSWHLLGLAHDVLGQAGHVDACLLSQQDSQKTRKRSHAEANGADEFERFDVEVDGCPACGRAWRSDEPPTGPSRTAHVEACLSAAQVELVEEEDGEIESIVDDTALPFTSLSEEAVRGKAHLFPVLARLLERSHADGKTRSVVLSSPSTEHITG